MAMYSWCSHLIPIKNGDVSNSFPYFPYQIVIFHFLLNMAILVDVPNVPTKMVIFPEFFHQIG